MMPEPLHSYFQSRRKMAEQALNHYLDTTNSHPEVIHEAMRYSVFAGGKRLRPVLVLAAAECCGAKPEIALPTAAAMELIHTYSLVHDDLPAMDDDDLRRGRPTSHKAYGEGLAILVGDALLTDAFLVMASAPGIPADRVRRAIAEVAAAAGSPGMVGGQALDLAATGRQATLPAVRQIHARKTGALLAVSVRTGAIVGGARPALLRRLDAYGRQLGLAFQIADDILDAGEAPDADGRTDRELGKATYP